MISMTVQMKLELNPNAKSLDELVDHKKLIEDGNEIFLDVIQELIDQAVEEATSEARGYKNEAIRLANVLADKEAKEHERAVAKAEKEAQRIAKKEQREKEKAERQKIREEEKEARRIAREEEREARRIAKEQEKEQRRLEKEAKEQRKIELKEITDRFVEEEGQSIIGYKLFPISTEYFDEHIFMNPYVKLSEQAKYKMLQEKENTKENKEFMKVFKRMNNMKKFIVLKTIDHKDFDLEEIRALKPNQQIEVVESLI